MLLVAGSWLADCLCVARLASSVLLTSYRHFPIHHFKSRAQHIWRVVAPVPTLEASHLQTHSWGLSPFRPVLLARVARPCPVISQPRLRGFPSPALRRPDSKSCRSRAATYLRVTEGGPANKKHSSAGANRLTKPLTAFLASLENLPANRFTCPGAPSSTFESLSLAALREQLTPAAESRLPSSGASIP